MTIKSTVVTCILAILALRGLPPATAAQHISYPAPPASISGFITDAVTGTELPAANITITGAAKGTASDSAGYYIINNLEGGTYTLTASYVGFRRYQKTLKVPPGVDVTVPITLEPQPYHLNELTVVPDKDPIDCFYDKVPYSNHSASNRSPGVTTSGPHEGPLPCPPETAIAKRRIPPILADLPTIFQEDLFRSLQLLPGVASSSDFSSGLYIRGGSPDQTLILFDQAPVYNPSHFFGFYSTFNPVAVGDVLLYKGNYPARYGGRLGSVLSVSGESGSRQQIGGTVSLGLLSASTSLHGPFADGDGSWSIAARRSTIEPVLGILQHSFEDIPERFYLLDLNGSLELQLDPRNHVSLTLYSGMDRLGFPFADDAGLSMNYGNQVGNMSWNHEFSDRASTTLKLSGSRYFNYPSFRAASTPYHRSNTINHISFSSDTKYFLNEFHQLSMGLEVNHRTLHLLDYYDGNRSFNTNIRGWNNTLYLEDMWSPSEQLQVTAGLRLMRYGSSNAFQTEPRLSLEYRPAERIRLNGAWGQYSQDITLISNESFSGLDVWLAAGEDIPVSHGDQFAVGITAIPREGYRFIMEGYYRSMNNLFEPDPLLLDRTGLPYRELFRYGEGYAYGTELSLERKTGSITGLVGYTFSKTFRKFPDVADFFYPTRFDRTHNLNFVLEHIFSSTWSINGVFRFTSGAPYTKIIGRGLYINSPLNDRGKFLAIPGDKNAARMPPYHRLDLGITRQGTFFGIGESELNFQLLNVYARRNTWFYTYDLDKGADYRQEVQLLPLLPSISYNISF